MIPTLAALIIAGLCLWTHIKNPPLPKDEIGPALNGEALEKAT